MSRYKDGHPPRLLDWRGPDHSCKRGSEPTGGTKCLKKPLSHATK